MVSLLPRGEVCFRMRLGEGVNCTLGILCRGREDKGGCSTCLALLVLTWQALPSFRVFIFTSFSAGRYFVCMVSM